MKPWIACTFVAVVFLFVGLAPRASGSCTNPNSILNATYGWQGEALLANGNTKVATCVDVALGHAEAGLPGNFRLGRQMLLTFTVREVVPAPCS